ncbi:MAG: cell division protein FtsA [bacterium]
MSNQDETIVAAVDIGTTKVVTVIAEIRGKQINVIGVGEEENNGSQQGTISNISEAARAVKASVEKAQKMAGKDIEVNNVIASVGGKHLTGIKSHGVTTLTLSREKEITQADKDRAIESAKSMPLPADREILHVIPTQYIIDGQDEIMDPLGMSGVRIETDVYIVTGATTLVENVRKTIKMAGYEMDDIYIQPIGSGNATLYEDEKELGVLLIDIGGGTTDIALYHKNALKFIKIIPVGGKYITGDLVPALQTSKSITEEIKKQYGLLYEEDAGEEIIEVPDRTRTSTRPMFRKDLAPYIKYRIYELFDMVKKELKNEGIDKSLYGAGIVLTGGGAKLNGLLRFVQENMGGSVRIGVPLQEKVTGRYEVIDKPQYSTVVGIIDYFVREHGKNERLISSSGGFLTKTSDKIKKFLSEFF